MRFVIAAAFAALVGIGPAQAASEAEGAFFERSALLAADAHCGLFAPNLRFALQASAAQARWALVRGGWSDADLHDLESQAAAPRACDDAAVQQSAARARAGFASWARTPSMRFAGDTRAWLALRNADAAGWRLRQDLATGVVFGVRQGGDAQHLSIAVPLPPGSAPAAAQLIVRDPARARANFDVPGRVAHGLEAGAPSPAAALHFWASSRSIESIAEQRVLVFTFPDAAFAAMDPLDPREAAEIRLGADGAGQRYLIEIGDLAAARAFLAVGGR